MLVWETTVSAFSWISLTFSSVLSKTSFAVSAIISRVSSPDFGANKIPVIAPNAAPTVNAAPITPSAKEILQYWHLLYHQLEVGSEDWNQTHSLILPSIQ